MKYTREQIEALTNTMQIQRHNLSEQIKETQNQLTMTDGAIQVLQHLLSLPNEENQPDNDTPDGAELNGDDNNGITTPDDD